MHQLIKHLFADDMVKVITSAFEQLSRTAFLEGPKQYFSQNSIESFNHLMWSLAPKDQHAPTYETSLALPLALCIFRKGMV